MVKPFLSIIIPAHNEEHRLPDTLEKTYQYVQAQSFPVEVLVVENGSQDATFQIAQDFASRHTGFRVFKEELSGKGRAVRRGMLEAKGDYRFMADADLSMPISETGRFIPPAVSAFDIAIGSREAKGAVRYNEPAYRHLGGRAINTLIRLLALPGLQDTQCGFKCFTGPVAEDLFRTQTMMGWSFDIELLYIARLRGYRIVEVPIPWYFNPESKLSAVKDALRMAMDILTIRRQARQGLYRTRPVKETSGVYSDKV